MPNQNIACIVGARPNFMKMAPILRALDAYSNVCTTLIHTGQHYDANLSDVFFQELGIKSPDHFLNIGGGKQGAQTARMLESLEATFEAGANDGETFDRVVVVGDVNSTLAATLAAVKLGIPVAHVEAGLRSFDRTMPEEINRIVTDSLADMLFVSEPSGVANLRQEGHPEEHVHLVGNVMIDTLRRMLPIAEARNVLQKHGVEKRQYGLVTFHRPANVDDSQSLSRVVDVLKWAATRIPLFFPIHPRTRARLEEFGLWEELAKTPKIKLLPPLGYLDCLALTQSAKVVITDSGGLQEETTVLGVPCITMRPNTERPITTESGTSTLVGNDPQKLRCALELVFSGGYKSGQAPSNWDGKTAERIAERLVAAHQSDEPAGLSDHAVIQ